LRARERETIDFHTHAIDPACMPDGPPTGIAVARLWELLTDIDARVAAMVVTGVMPAGVLP
jgi:hypothetical protein